MRERHWSEIENVLNFKADQTQPVTLKVLAETDIMSKAENLTDIAARAIAEAELESLLRKVNLKWIGASNKVFSS